ncbi:MAG: RsmB/NOP family class I SAM-dependent RNA methyltransferase [Lachnospiraceae bacterium]|nr:RsmB/NOP family class I SAM-dependent RNA methyltransferase [Lachnospiraceae bacterium]
MERLLGEEMPAYLASLEERPRAGLRVNAMKLSAGEFLSRSPFILEPVPWCDCGFVLAGEERASRHPWYAAGLYYLQEPSAMAPAAFLPVEPGDTVLDLCAAPGGKSTALGAKLGGTGFLLSNDVSRSRSRALLRNLEGFGIGNMAVSCELPEKLASLFPGRFDKILVDAPCSGEGMFRREPSMVPAWEKRGPEEFAPLQRSILTAAAALLAPGGKLLYSTCTFSEEEDEDNVLWLLEQHPELSLVPVEKTGGMEDGRKGLSGCARFYPHRTVGEGHFLALFEKSADAPLPQGQASSFPADRRSVAEILGTDPVFSRIGRDFDGCDAVVKGDLLYAVPKGAPLDRSLGYLRTGLLLGEIKKHGFEPYQALAMTLSPQTFSSCVDLPSEDVRVIRYLKGETVDLAPGEAAGDEGWILVCTDGFALGFAKRTGLRLKNKYHAGWRWQA